ncbi:flavin reductase like domain-containing protein [Pyrenochaeta sp. MPI-SDFR-AT-0127]|nr:flavin reductase like domain-containing protein [Pyrenochaeta sp. MPI-SDFR-AT-0127]
MALLQRPASHFFAAFYRWNLHTQRMRSCSISCQRSQNGIRCSQSIFLRKYHATRLLRQQVQPEPQEQSEEAKTHNEDIRDLCTRGAGRIADGQQTSSMQEGATERPGKDKLEDLVDSAEMNIEEQELKTAVRGLLRKVPSSVAVITVQSVDPDTNKHVPMGVAVSSLSSVTLDPPTISFNIKHPSKTLDAIRAANGRFRVHFPGADRGGANIVELFCRGNHPDAYQMRSRDLKLYVPSYRKDERSTGSLAPQIWNDSVRAALECTVTHEFPVADHVIIAARVDSLEQKTSKEPTIVYVDGSYMRSDTKIAVHGKPKAARSDDGWSIWDYSLFLGENERWNYMERIQTIVRGNAYYLDTSIKEASRDLELNLPYAPSAFGINTELLILHCRKETGCSDALSPDHENMPVLSDFYGRLSPPAKAKIIDRAIRLVKEDPRFLSLNYKTFLNHLSVGSSSRDLFPSDIMNSLRAEGLVAAFEPDKGDHGPIHKTHYHIKRLEQAEHKLLQYFRTLKYETALNVRLESIMDSIGEDKYAAICFKHCRSRLIAETHPQRLVDSKVDIVGDVTHEEARVVLSRIRHFLQVTNLREFRKKITLAPYEILRLSHVHPTITGLDIEYLLAKISHLYYSASRFRYLAGTIDEMMAPWFDSIVGWHELEARVQQFVQKMPLRATSWSNRDKLAAMGLDWDATVTVPVQGGEDTQQPLRQGRILDTLVAKELKIHHGNGTEDENRAIAKYLKETYDFDIQSRPTTYAPRGSARRSSNDDVSEAMTPDPKVNIANDQSTQTEHVAISKGRTVAPRSRARTIRNVAADNHVMPPEGANGSNFSWTSYSLGGRKK